MALAPDIVCLTEAYRDFFGGIGQVIDALPDYGYPVIKGRRKAPLWSRNPWREEAVVGHPALPGGRFVAGVIGTPPGDIRVVGVCMPWAKVHVGSSRRDRATWEDHLAYLEGLVAYLPADPEHLVVLSDFNQKVPRRYQPQHVADALQRTVLDRLELATAGEIASMGKQSIDHICHSRDLWADTVAGIPNIGPDGRLLSDHFGMRIRLAPVLRERQLLQRTTPRWPARLAEHAVLVGIERHRLAVAFDVLSGRVHIAESVLGLDRLQMQQLARRIVDEDEQSALRPAVLQPPVP